MQLIDPYTIVYKGIYAVCDKNNSSVELIEHSNCFGGSAWARYHYSKSPLVMGTRTVGDMIRYLLKTGTSELNLKSSTAAAGIESVLVKGSEVEITYAGLGGGGVGATICRAKAKGVRRYCISDSGGGKKAKGTIVVPRRERLIVGIDNTDSKEEGATWTLAHNIAIAVDRDEAKYLSHSLVQLYPVPSKTQNCVSTVLEFACIDEASKNSTLADIKSLLEKYSVSDQTGMVALSSFDARSLEGYSKLCRSRMIDRKLTLQAAEESGVEIWMDGNGIIGALAALPWFARCDESIIAEEIIGEKTE